jgi:UDP-glucose:(heptosyl)LPS alpha-1,3-glucosyltransferase
MGRNNPIRVAVVIPKYGLTGGAETFVFELCERLALLEEFQIHVFANKWRQGKAPVTFHKVPTIKFPRFLEPISFAYWANQRIRQRDFTLVHSHERIFEMDLFTFHGIPHKEWVRTTRTRPTSLFDRATAWVEQKGLSNRHLQMIMPVSSLAKEALLKIYDFPESKVMVNPPGIDAGRFSALDPQACRREVFQRHGLSYEDIVVLFVSMNFELKRLDLVLKGIAGLVAQENRNLPVKLMVAGKGDSRRFTALARDLGIVERVIFVGVIREMEKYYMASDIFTMPSKYDTFGLAVLEAMAAGLPVIISGSVGARDLVETGINGFVLTDNPTAPEMTAALGSLVKREKRLQMGEKGREVAARNTWDKTTDRIADLYLRLAGVLPAAKLGRKSEPVPFRAGRNKISTI